MAVNEADLMKALDDMESLAKGKKPAKSGKKLSLKEWAEQGSEESAHKGEDGDDFEEVAEDEEDIDKAVDDDDSESESSDDEESSEDDEPPVKKAKKSTDIADIMKSDGANGGLIDVSPFIESLVEQVSESDQRLRKSVIALRDESRAYNRAQSTVINILAKAMVKLEKSLEAFGDLPAGERQTALSKSEVEERFEAPAFQFSRGQVLDAMFELTKSNQISGLAVTNYESFGSMESDVLAKVEAYFKKSA